MLIRPDGNIVQQMDPHHPNFLGMYHDSFPARCWSPDGQSLVFSTPSRSSFLSFILHLGKSINQSQKSLHFSKTLSFSGSSEIRQLSLPDGCAGSFVLDVLEDLILLVGLSLTHPDQLFIGRVDWNAKSTSIDWKCLSNHNQLPIGDSLTSHLIVLNTPEAVDYEAMLVHRKESTREPIPLIVYPHGGPHCVYSDQFSSEVYFFTQLGKSTLFSFLNIK